MMKAASAMVQWCILGGEERWNEGDFIKQCKFYRDLVDHSHGFLETLAWPCLLQTISFSVLSTNLWPLLSPSLQLHNCDCWWAQNMKLHF